MVLLSEQRAPVRVDKSVELWFLLRAGLPLVAAGVGGGVLYTWLAVIAEDLPQLWIGPPLLFGGAALGGLGVWSRVREVRSTGAPNTRRYWLLFLAWAMVLVGLVLPFYLS